MNAQALCVRTNLLCHIHMCTCMCSTMCRAVARYTICLMLCMYVLVCVSHEQDMVTAARRCMRNHAHAQIVILQMCICTREPTRACTRGHNDSLAYMYRYARSCRHVYVHSIRLYDVRRYMHVLGVCVWACTRRVLTVIVARLWTHVWECVFSCRLQCACSCVMNERALVS